MPNISRPELTWSGKYDDQGNVRPVERTILPFQVVETINESKADREASQRDFFTKRAQDKTWRNRLVWGDNKIVMSSLLPELAGKIDLIYIDPPFATGQDFSFRAQVGDLEVEKLPSIIEERAYRDMWGKDTAKGIDQFSRYLGYMHERLILMRELLADDGTIYIHIDWTIGHYLKVVADEVFGEDGFRNEIIWYYTNKLGTGGNTFDKHHDNLLVYVKGEQWFHKPLMRPVKDQKLQPVTQKIEGQRVWLRDEEGKRRYEMGRAETKIGDVWEIPYINPVASERLGYATQKPEALLQSVIEASSQQGDLVADFFCGSGTTLAVAERLGRRWLGVDLSKWSVQVTRKRLLQIENSRSFEMQNLGHYERHKLASNGHGAWERYVRFVLELYRAEPVTGFKNLHGKKARAYVHVGSVDSPITMREIRAALEEAKKNGVKEIHFLGWDFEMGIHDLSAEIQDEYGVKPRLVSIPKEALEVSNPAKEEVRFFDLNYLEVEHDVKARKITVALKDFIIANPEYLPDDVRERIKKFTDYVDYWAVDWDYRDDTFHNQWQSFRTRKEPKLETKASFTYEKPGKYKVLVKVVDIFGNDTTKMIEVSVK